MSGIALTVLVLITILRVRVNAQQVKLFPGMPVQPESFLSSVSKQTGYVFFYDVSLLDHIPPISVQLKNVSLDSAMRAVFKNQFFTYAIQGKTVFITPVKVALPPSSAGKISRLEKIRGRVVDESGIPVLGASIVSGDSKISSFTHENGDFQIMMEKGDSLAISCIGYSKMVTKPDSSFVAIVLQNSSSPLEQVVIGGNLFAVKRKSDISSFTVTDDNKIWGHHQIPRYLQEIYRGLVPALTNGYSVGDQTQNNPTLTIRGAASENSISDDQRYVLMVWNWRAAQEFLSTLNKENIDRIEVLRGSESSTLYGTGSNGGIVQIYTKRVTEFE